MSKLVVVKDQTETGVGWEATGKFRLCSTDQLPTMSERRFDSYDEAKIAASDRFIESGAVGSTLWTPAVSSQAPSAKERQDARRRQAVLRSIPLIQSGRYYTERLVLCTPEGDLRPSDQPTNSFAVFEAGQGHAIYVFSSAELAAGEAELNRRRDQKEAERQKEPSPKTPGGRRR